MAGNELVTEGFKEGQVGSSAMPHKMNSRSAERVNGLSVVLRGHLSMIGELAGDQWNEGDVSDSVVRRVALPDAFFAADGLFETFLTVLDEFGAFPAVIQRELDRYLPFLSTTKVLMAAVRNGVGRESAHEAIKEAAVGTALDMRKGQADNDVFARLAADPRLGLTEAQLASLVAEPITFTGAAVDQVQAVVRRVAEVDRPSPRGRGVLTRRHPLESPATLGAGAGHGQTVTESREETYRRLYASHFDAVLGYALRRTDRPEDAADVTAETFLVAWRRLAHVPTGAETRPVAVRRRPAGARQPSSRQPPRTALGDRLRQELATSRARHQRRRGAARRRRDGDAPAQRPRPGGARAAPLGGPRAARDRRGARPHHRGRPAAPLPGPGPVARAAPRQRSATTRTSPLQTIRSSPGRSGHESPS